MEINRWDRFPFRIGTTSYIVEAGLLDNLRWLTGRVGEMQLVLFDAPEASNLPTPEEVRELGLVARDADMAFTVHLPTAIEPGHPDPAVRAASCELFRRVVDLTAPLSPLCWVFHLFGAPPGEGTSEQAHESLARLMGELDSPRDVAIENIHPGFAPEGAIAESLDTSVCIDVGHLLCQGQDVEAHLQKWLPRCRAVHLHAVDEKRIPKDHAPLDLLPPGFAARLFDRLTEAPDLKTVTMEVFGREDFERSVAAIREIFINSASGQ